MSPLLSSGFVPGLFSWSTVCALDEEHPMFGGNKKRKRDESRTWKLSRKQAQAQISELPVSSWKQGQLNSVRFLRVAGHHYLPLSVWVFMHGLLPSCPRKKKKKICYEHAAEQGRLYCWMFPDCSPAHSHTIHAGGGGEANMCRKCVSSPLEEGPAWRRSTTLW